MAEPILVTGGAGFIGSHLVEALVSAGQTVRVLDDLSTGLRDNLKHLHPAPELLVGDVRECGLVERALRGVKIVYHLAALASVQKSIENPVDSHQSNDTATVLLLDAARRAGVQRVIFAGSASAYGIPAGEVQSEDDPLSPLSPYAAAKLAGEMYMQAFAQTYPLETVRLRFFNVFGPRQRPDSPYSGVIALFAAAMSAGKAPTIFGDGLQTRDFVYVSDVVCALQLAATTRGISGRVYNIATGRKTTLLDLVASLNRLLGTTLVPIHQPGRMGDIRHSCANIERAQRELGYQPQVDFTIGLAHTLAWYRAGGKQSHEPA